MFQSILILPLFLFLIYRAAAQEKKKIKWLIVGYFGLVSVLFMAGGMYISAAYHLYDGPAAAGGFQRLFDWVHTFSYLYIVPLVPLFGYKLFALSLEMFGAGWVQTAMFAFWIVLLLGAAFVSFFAFILMFYGFAP